MFQRIMRWIIGILIVVVILYIVLLSGQIFYETQGARFFKQGKYDVAAEKYLRAYEAASLWGHDRYLYLVAQCYYNAEDWQRAMDFYIRLNKEYPGSVFCITAGPSLDRTLDRLIPDRLGPPTITEQSPLGRALSNLKGAHKRLVDAIRYNRSGVSAELMNEYENYKRYYQLYKRELSAAWAQVQAGKKPEELDGPPQIPVIEPGK